MAEPTLQEMYEKRRKKYLDKRIMDESGRKDIESRGYNPETGEPSADMAQSTNKNAALTAMQSGGGPGNMLATYGAASGNPYALGGGLALSTLASISEKRRLRKQQEEEIKSQMSIDRISRQRNAINQLINVSRGLTI